MTRFFIPHALGVERADLRRRAEVALFLSLVWIPAAILRSLVFFAYDVRWQAWVALLASAIGCLLPCLLRATGSLSAFGNSVALVWFLTLSSLCVIRGGIAAPPLVGLGLVPLGATFMAGSRSGIAWCAAVVTEIACFAVLESVGLKLPDRLPTESRTLIQALGALLFTVAFTWFAVAYERATSVAVEALRRSEQNSRALLAAMPDVGFRMSQDGVTLAVHGRREQLAKAPPWSIGSCVDVVAPELSQVMRATIARALDSGEIVRVELEAGVDGEHRQYEGRMAASGPGEVFMVLRDLTDALTLARRLSRAEEEAQLLRADRMASVGQLAAAVAHEANNPLAYVLANLSFVQGRLAELRGADVELARPGLDEALSECQQGAERVRQIVRDLKTFARPDDEQQQPVRVAHVMDAALKVAALEIRHRARLKKRYGDPPLIFANEGRLAQVFVNLLVNAAQAIEPGRAEANEICVVLARDDAGHALIEVSDTGAGILPEHLARVTEPFFTTKPIGVGTGLGLTVCKNIAESYGGRLELTSSAGAGTTARIVLPAAFRGAPGDVCLDPPMSASASPPARYRILAIDDDPLVLKALRRVLRAHDLTSARGGAEALALIAQEPAFQVILCDVMMPDLTGIDVYRRIEACAPGLERRVVFMSGGAFTEQTRAFLASTLNLRIEKPFSPDALEQAIRRTAQLEA